MDEQPRQQPRRLSLDGRDLGADLLQRRIGSGL